MKHVSKQNGDRNCVEMWAKLVIICLISGDGTAMSSNQKPYMQQISCDNLCYPPKLPSIKSLMQCMVFTFPKLGKPGHPHRKSLHPCNVTYLSNAAAEQALLYMVRNCCSSVLHVVLPQNGLG